MSTYDQAITRTGASATIPEQVTAQIFAAMPGQSIVMSQGLRLPNAVRGQMRIPVWSTLPVAYFVSPTDTGLKQTSSFSWDNVYAYMEEIAIIIPIPEAVLEDSAYDIFGEAMPSIAEAFGQTLDAAVIHGTNKPTSWTFASIVAGASTASQTVDLSTTQGASGDLYDAVLGRNGTFQMVEKNGLAVTGSIAAMSMKGQFRDVRGADGHPVFLPDPTGKGVDMLAGSPITFPTNGALDTTAALLVSGDWKKLAFSIRQELKYKLLTEASIYNNSGTLVYALAQQDMVALRVTMRIGVAIVNPPNRVQPTAALRYPWAVLVP